MGPVEGTDTHRRIKIILLRNKNIMIMAEAEGCPLQDEVGEEALCQEAPHRMDIEVVSIKGVEDKAEDIQMVALLEEEAGLPLWKGPPLPTLDVSKISSRITGCNTDYSTARAARKPLKTPPLSPDQAPWDNPFPTFPGAKKKTSVSEEQEILHKMAAMEVGGPPQPRPRTAGNKGGQDRHPRGAPADDFGRPIVEGRKPPPDDYGRSSLDNQRNMPPRNYPPQGPPQQGFQEPRRGPPGPNGYGPPPRQNTYAEPGYNDRVGYGQGPVSPLREDFSPPPRSMTLPNEPPMPMGRQPPMPTQMGGQNERPYNGPVGRGMPPRPSTASGNRPPQQRGYPNQAPPMDPYANGNGGPRGQGYGGDRSRKESVSDFYDSYYDGPDAGPARPQSAGSVMPNFDNAPPANPAKQRRGNSIDDHMQPPVQQQGGYQQAKPIQSQPDVRGRAQPQAAVFEMAGEAPPVPNAYPQQGYDDGYGNGQYNQGPGQRGPPPVQGYDGYDDPTQQNGFQPSAQSTSSAPRAGPGFPGGLPSGPKLGFAGLPNGPAPNGGMPRQSPPNAGGLPQHPPPVRAGLIPNSGTAMNDKPPPVRNYNNVNPVQQPLPPQNSAAGAPPAAEQAPVTNAELEQLRNTITRNPNDQEAQMMLARRLVEASEVLVPQIPDQRARNKAREKYIMDAHKLLKKLVQVQNTEAMFYLADCYGRGSLGLEADNKEAFSLYQSAAKAGHAAAAYRTAVCCELGNEEGGGTRKDPLKAIQWYKRAAMLGDTPAMYKMGMIQLKGLLGQPKNPREAVGWLKRAAERADAENPHALHELGLLYEAPQSTDNSVVRDETYSFSLFQQAADLGYKFSQFRLGCAYEYGLFNCPIDPRQSIMWYSRAAAQEEHQSELALSGWYLTGSEGVLQQSDTEAYLWARKAAMSGLAKAEYAMGYFTEVGIGAPANLEDAKRWYWRAAGMFFLIPSHPVTGVC
jgi:TPR repeat protein